MKVVFVCVGAFMALCSLGRASGATVAAAMAEARSLVGQGPAAVKQQEDRFIGLALDVAGGCPATVAGDADSASRAERKQILDALISAVAESGSRRGLTKLLRLASCGAESASWGREKILERAMARMMADVPCLPPLPGEVAREREGLVDFPVLRLRDGHLHADFPTHAELDDLAYFMVAASSAGDEIGVVKALPSRHEKFPPSLRHDTLFGLFVAAKSGGNVVDIERAARTYVEDLGFPEPIRGEAASLAGAPRYVTVLRELAQSWEALGRFHDAAGVWRRPLSPDGAGAATWEEQVKAVIRDEEIDGRCDVAVAERLLDVDSGLYGIRRLSDAKFDVARLLRGALLTINRDAGEGALKNAIATWPNTSRLFAEIRLRDKGLEDWERRLHASRGLADVMQERAIPLLLRAAGDSLPPGRQRAISAIGDLAVRPSFDPCRSPVPLPPRGDAAWTRPLRPFGLVCDSERADETRRRLVGQLAVFARDASPGTREAVASALGKIGLPSARPILKRMLGDGETQEAARRALDNIGELERNWRNDR